MIHKGRLEAFSDGVIAIIITIMVLEIKVPHGEDWKALGELTPKFLSYVLSYLYVGIYWNNHHHLLKAARGVNATIMWLNLLLLFFLSLIPFVTGWLGESHFAPSPSALYSLILLLCAVSYWFLQCAIVKGHGGHSELLTALGRDIKGKISPLFYLTALVLSLAGWPLFATLLNACAGLMWLVPDRRIEKALADLPGE